MGVCLPTESATNARAQTHVRGSPSSDAPSARSHQWLPNKDPMSYSACQIGPKRILLVSVMPAQTPATREAPTSISYSILFY
jgi:hypothetical protein